MLVVCCTQQWGDLGKSQQVLDTLLHHQGEVYTFLIQAPTHQGTKTSWKCQVHTADPSLTGSSCNGCHLRVTLPSAVPEDQVSSQQAQGNSGRQDLGSRTADPSGRQCHTTAERWKQVLWNWEPAHFSYYWFLKGLSVLQENLKLQEKWGGERCRQHHH